MQEFEFDKHLRFYLEQGKKVEDMRDDIRYRELAKQLGYTIRYGKSFGDSLSFARGEKVIWYCPYVINSGTKDFEIIHRWRCRDYPDSSKGEILKESRDYRELNIALVREA